MVNMHVVLDQIMWFLLQVNCRAYLWKEFISELGLFMLYDIKLRLGSYIVYLYQYFIYGMSLVTSVYFHLYICSTWYVPLSARSSVAIVSSHSPKGPFWRWLRWWSVTYANILFIYTESSLKKSFILIDRWSAIIGKIFTRRKPS